MENEKYEKATIAPDQERTEPAAHTFVVDNYGGTMSAQPIEGGQNLPSVKPFDTK